MTDSTAMGGTSELRGMIAESVNRMFAEQVDRRVLDHVESGGWADALWQLVEDGRFHRILVPEADDGAGAAWSDAYPLLYALGYYRVPLPLAETLIANALLAHAHLPLPDGPLTIIQQGYGNHLQLTLQGGKLNVDGSVAAVPWARFANGYVIAGTAGATPVIALVKKGAAGARINEAVTVSREPRDSVTFTSCTTSEFASAPTDAVPQPVLLCGALVRAAMMVGAEESILHQTVQYANERVQFGRPIAKFQAVQQAIAILASEVTSAQTATLAAYASADTKLSRFDIAVAKIRSGQAAGIAAAISHQVHGAFGYTYDHTLQYATRRLWSWRAEFGAESAWAQELGEQAIRRGAQAFWGDLTARYATT